MGWLKGKFNTPLGKLGLFDEQQILRLRAASITTVEEVFASARSDPEAVAAFTGFDDIAQLQADAAPMVMSALSAGERLVADRRLSLGARAPRGVDIEETASEETFESYESDSRSTDCGDAGLRVDLRPRLGSVRDQGDRGTCVGHACAAVIEALEGRPPTQLSPQYLYFQAKQRDGLPAGDEGTFADVAMRTVVDVGVCEEQFWPYEPDARRGDFTHGRPSADADANALLHRAASSEVLGNRDVQAIRSVLDEGRPVELSVPVYSNWYTSAATAMTGVIPMPMPHSRLEGGHAMCAVGYGCDADDIAGGWFFVLRNSWGTDWAQQSEIEPGYAAIPFLYVEKYGWEAVTARL